MSDYYSQLALMRQERHQREALQRVNEIATEHREAERYRDEAGDVDDWNYWDGEAERLEAEYHRLCPPQQQLSDAKQRFIPSDGTFHTRSGT